MKRFYQIEYDYLTFLKSMKENQERAEVERNRNLRYGGNTGNSTELNNFLSDDKGQGSQERYPVPFRLEIEF